MLALTIDNFPPALHAKLQEVALRNHVSIAQQVQLLLEYGLTNNRWLSANHEVMERDPRNHLPRSSLPAKDLNEFFAQLPRLGEDAEDFAEEVQAIRHSLPLEADAWA